MIELIIARSLQEYAGAQRDADFRSEPLQLLLHGVPGAGKSQTLKWIRPFFEEVCNSKHEREFVFLASQNTMAAPIEGLTLHPYGDIPFYCDDGGKSECTEAKQRSRHEPPLRAARAPQLDLYRRG